METKSLFMVTDDQIESLISRIADEVMNRLEGIAAKTDATAGSNADNGDLLSPGQAANFLGISKVSLWRYAKEGRIEPIRLSPKVIRYRRSDIDNLQTF